MEGKLMPIEKALEIARQFGRLTPFSTGLPGDDELKGTTLYLHTLVKAKTNEEAGRKERRLKMVAEYKAEKAKLTLKSASRISYIVGTL